MKSLIIITAFVFLVCVTADGGKGKWRKKKEQMLKVMCEGENDCQSCVRKELAATKEEWKQFKRDLNKTEEEKSVACKLRMANIAANCSAVPEKVEALCRFWKEKRQYWKEQKAKMLNDVCGEENNECKTCIETEKEAKKEEWRKNKGDFADKTEEEKLKECKTTMDEIATKCQGDSTKLQGICDFWSERKKKWLNSACGDSDECKTCVKEQQKAKKKEWVENKYFDKPEEEQVTQCQANMDEVAKNCNGNSDVLQSSCHFWMQRKNHWGKWKVAKHDEAEEVVANADKEKSD